MLFDGSHALVTGDYVRPSSGEHAGQLGPWTAILELVGLDPLSLGCRLFLVAYGGAWLAGLVGFVRGERWGWRAMAAGAAGSLWYLVAGTLQSLLVLALLFTPPLRRAFAERSRA